MKRLRFYEFGDLANLRVEEAPALQPGPDEVLVQLRGASINPSDVKNVQGRMEGTTLPRVPGRDFAGVVLRGPAKWQGAEVWGTGGEIGFTRDGSHAEQILIPASALTRKPENLTFEEAACVGLNYVTAYEGLIVRAKIRAGEILLVSGARGGVGSAVLQLGQVRGAKLIAVDRRPLNPAVFEGIDLLGYLDSGDPEFRDAVLQTNGGHGVDVVYDCVGGDLFEPLLSTLGPLGRQIAITSAGKRRVDFDLLDFYHRRLSLIGVDSRALTSTDCALLLAAMAPYFLDGPLRPARIAKRGSLSDVEAMYRFVDKGADGKAVFVFE